jgi:UDP-N-acetylmuramoyl-L-alanyl-D-glutamate--2,6-diaminopimelate ligase
LEIVDRKQAIKSAVMMAQQGDIVLIAGKGHEKYQEIKGERLAFDDVQEVTHLLNS